MCVMCTISDCRCPHISHATGLHDNSEEDKVDAATWFYMCPSATAVEAVSQDLKRSRKKEYPQGLQPELGWGCRWGNAKVIPQFPIALMTELETRVGRPHCYIMEQPHGGSLVNVKSYTLYNSYNSVWQDPTCNCVTMHVSI